MQSLKSSIMPWPAGLRAPIFTVASLCAAFVQAGGYVPFCSEVTCSPRVLQATSIEISNGSVVQPTFNNATMTDKNTIAETNNNLIKTPSSADPVSTVTGNNYHDETDIVIAGRAGLNYVFTRTYNSAPSSTKVDSGLGFGWVHSYGMRLVSNHYGKFPNCANNTAVCPENADNVTSSVTYTDERGGDHNYLVNGATVKAPQGEFDSLVLDTPVGVHTLTFTNGNKYIFETVGAGTLKTTPGLKARLKQIVDPWGNQINLIYDTSNRLWKVTDNLGIGVRTGLLFTYDASNHIRTIQDWSNRTWTYVVNADKNLQSYTGPEPLGTPGAVSMKYGYARAANNQPTHNLETIEKPLLRDGKKVQTTFIYYENGRTFSNFNGMGNTETLDYDLFRSSTRITDPRGGVREYQYDSSGRLTQLVQADGSILKFENQVDGLRWRKWDELGYATTYRYSTIGADSPLTAADANGNSTGELNRLGRGYQITYGPLSQVADLFNIRGNRLRTTFYDTAGNCSAIGKPRTVTASSLNFGWSLKSDVLLKTYCWNADGTLKSLTETLEPNDPAKTRVTTYNYDAAHLVVESVVVGGWDGLTLTRSFGYDTLGRKTTETIMRRTSPTDETLIPLVTTTTYDALDRVVLVEDPAGNRKISRYDDNGQLWQETVEYKKPDQSFETRNTVTRTFDAADRVVTATDHLQGVTRFRYDEAGNVTSITDADDHTTHFEYDAMNRRTAVIDANGARTTTAYTQRGEVKSITNAAGEVTQFEYDKEGRRTSVKDPHGYITSSGYDWDGNLTCVIDANAAVGLQQKNNEGGCSVTYRVDGLHRTYMAVDALNGKTGVELSNVGQRLAHFDAYGSRYTWTYDSIGRLIRETDPLGKSVNYKVDEAGNVWESTNRLNEVTRTTFDRLNRKTQVEYVKDGSIETFGYDPAGNVSSMSNAAVTYTFYYDPLNRVISKADSRGRSLAFSYSKTGNLLTKTTYSGSTTTYTYDAANHLVAMSNPDYVSVNYQNDAAGRPLSRILSSGAKSIYTYDSGGWLSGLKHVDAAGVTIVDQSYNRDRMGNITNITVAGAGTTGYKFDALYRLTKVEAPNVADSRFFGYDLVGNRVIEVRGGTVYGDPGSTAIGYLYQNSPYSQGTSGPGANNRLRELRIGGYTGELDSSFFYDDEGRLVSQTGTTPRTLTWNAKGQLASDGTETYTYDPLGNRIRRSGGPLGTLDYFLEGDHLESVYKGSKVQEKYFRGLLIDELVAGFTTQNDKLTPYFFQHDYVNSVVAVSKPNGGLQQKAVYEPFGTDMAGTGSPVGRLKYTGREDDGNGQYHYRARYYDPRIGRFISEDPKGLAAGVNLFAYVGNNPINGRDPSGLDVLVSQSGNNVDLHWRLVFTGPAATTQNVSNATATIGSWWSGDKSIPNTFPTEKYRVNATVTSLASQDPAQVAALVDRGYTQVNLLETGDPRLTLDPNTGLHSRSNQGEIGNWNVESPWAYAHEGGHIALLQDRYTGAGTDFGWQGNMMGSYGGGVDGRNISGILQATGNASGSFSNISLSPNGSLSNWGINFSPAAGGFLIYPSKPNTNQQNTIYAK